MGSPFPLDTISYPKLKDIQVKFLSAAEKGKIDEVKLLLQENPSLLNSQDNDGYSALHRACYNNQAEVVKFLLEKGANISIETIDGWQPLHSACKWLSRECVELLILAGADVNAVTEGGNTPLHTISNGLETKFILEMFFFHPLFNPSIKNKSGDCCIDIIQRSCSCYGISDMMNPDINYI